MKICYFNSGYLPDRGGVATLAAGLAENMALHPAVDTVRVVAFKNTNPRTEKRGKLEIYAYGSWHTWQMIWLSFRHAWRARNFDIFHATNIFPVGFLVLFFGKYLFGRKVFLTIHGTDTVTTRGSAFTRALKSWTLRRVDAVLSNSRSTAELAAAANGVERKKFTPVYIGVDEHLLETPAEGVREKHGLSEKDFVVLTVGQLTRRKGVDDLIRAVAKISDPAVKLLVVGKGSEKERLQELAADLKTGSRVIFAGAVSEIAGYYRAADVFSLTSRFIKEEGDVEGFGIVFLEAQLFGLPVIGTESGGIPETLRDGATGFLVPEGDSAAIAEKILHLKNNRREYERMAVAAEEFVRREFSWKKSVERHLEIYDKI